MDSSFFGTPVYITCVHTRQIENENLELIGSM
jgi:hypothetical protein